MIPGWLTRIVQGSTVTFVLAMSAMAQDMERPLTLEVLPTSQRVTVGKPIKLTFRLRNVSTKRVLVGRWLSLGQMVYLDITPPSGQKMQWCGRIYSGLLSRSNFVVLSPGESVERTQVISCDNERTAGYKIDSAGDFVVKARYRVGYPQSDLDEIAEGSLALKGPIQAPEVRLEVVAPAGTGSGEPKPPKP